jgi:hypothetical protein
MKKCSSRRPRRRSRARIRPEDGASSGFFSTLLGQLTRDPFALTPCPARSVEGIDKAFIMKIGKGGIRGLMICCGPALRSRDARRLAVAGRASLFVSCFALD